MTWTLCFIPVQDAGSQLELILEINNNAHAFHSVRSIFEEQNTTACDGQTEGDVRMNALGTDRTDQEDDRASWWRFCRATGTRESLSKHGLQGDRR